MRIWRSLDEVATDLGRTVVTIGNFDGVHRGHQHVVRRAHEVAADLGIGHVVAVTFDPHPIAVLRPEHTPPTLTTIERRVELLTEAGVDDVLVVPFSRDMATWSPDRFAEEIIVQALRAKAVVVGANFRFGYRAAGDVAVLRDLGEKYDFVVEGIALEGGPQVWSSTYIRHCLTAGDVEGAAEALGHPFTVRGVVVRGDQRGRSLGYPTANVPASGMQAVPADGVYAGWLRRLDRDADEADRGGAGANRDGANGDGANDDGADYNDSGYLPAAISVGTNPTFAGERERRVESYVLDRDDLELYDVPVEVSFVAHIRGMTRFDSVEELVATMADDVERTRSALAGA